MPFDTSKKKIPLSELVVVGSIDLMVTEVGYELGPSFKELSHGRDLDSLRVAGIASFGVLKAGAVPGVLAPGGRLPVKQLGTGKRVIFRKDLSGNWLIPSTPGCCSQLVLVAEEKGALHLDAWEYAVASSKKSWEEASKATVLGWKNMSEASKKGWEQASEATKAGWEKTSASTTPLLKDTHSKMNDLLTKCVEKPKAIQNGSKK